MSDVQNSTRLSTADPRDYAALLKPRVMSLVVFTAFVGIIVAPGAVPSWPLALISLLAIAVGAGASGALNMWVDADIDAVMERTKNRPIPAGRVTPDSALGFGLALSAFSVVTLILASNYVAGALLGFTIIFYAVIYSIYLKRSTPQNIVIGGAAGALPPVVGWAAVTGSAPLDAWILFAIILLWTPPHFWALALYKKGDYEKAGIPMMPNVAGEKSTKNQILVYTALLVLISFAPVVTGLGNWPYGLIAAGLGAKFGINAWRLHKAPAGAATDQAAKQLFGFSILYLFIIFAALMAEHLSGLHG